VKQSYLVELIPSIAEGYQKYYCHRRARKLGSPPLCCDRKL